jgi:hypothetical protein
MRGRPPAVGEFSARSGCWSANGGGLERFQEVNFAEGGTCLTDEVRASSLEVPSVFVSMLQIF